MKGLSEKEWILLSHHIRPNEELCNKLGYTKAQLLLNRGVSSDELLRGKLKSLVPPFDLPNIQRAVDLITDHVLRGKRIIIFGDYDVDGITGTAILFDLLKKAKAKVLPVLPSRKRGYGLTRELVLKLNNYADLLITVDNGTTAIEELSLTTIPTIILDHHNPGESLPNSLVVNPKLISREKWDLRDLSSAGLAFYLSILLRKHLELDIDVRNYLHFACLGTVADVMPMNPTNRLIVSKGMELLNYVLRGFGPFPGLRLLMERAGVRGEITSRDIAFSIAPRLNAPGRVAKPYVALKLLLEDKEERARLLIERVDKLNERRRQLSQKAFEEALLQAEAQKEKYLILVKLQQDMGGVAGIVAGKLANHYCKPAVVMAVGRDYTTASVRGDFGMDVYSALKKASHLFVKWGGHSSAVGFTIKTDKLKEFEGIAKDIFKDVQIGDRRLYIDMGLPLSIINEEIYGVLRDLEPFGEGFPEPVFMSEPLDMSPLDGDRDRLRLKAGDFYLLSWDPAINNKLLMAEKKTRRVVYQIDRKRSRCLSLVDVEE
ncbi:MAG: single-stranded-DNA-specific exonuclease RecJ [Aquificaceae bacterium]